MDAAPTPAAEPTQPPQSPNLPRRPGRRSPLRLVLSVLKWLAVGVVGLVVLLVAMLYVPGVLNAVAHHVLPMVEQSSGLRISVDNVSLRLPMRLSVDRAVVIDTRVPAPADTMVTARSLTASVDLLPLLGGDIRISSARLLSAMYQMGGPDSLYIRADVDSLEAGGALLAMSRGLIDVERARLAGARVSLVMGDSATAEKTDTTATSPITIRARHVELSRVDYAMRMAAAPDTSVAATPDTIAARIALATLTDGLVRIMPDTIAINAAALAIDAPSALYGKCGVTPLPGLDLSMLMLDSTVIRVDSFAMRGTELHVPITRLHTRERCGITLDADGLFAMDSTSLSVRNMSLFTAHSSLLVDATMGLDSVASRSPLDARLTASIATEDVAMALPALAPMLEQMPAGVPLRLDAALSGTMDSLTVDTLNVGMYNIFALTVDGTALHLTDPARLQAGIDLAGRLENPAPVQRLLGPAIKLPPIALQGHASAMGQSYAANLTGRTGAGRLALDATYSGTAPDYSLRARLDSFPVAAFMPTLGVGAVTATISARGHGFDPMSPYTAMQARAHVSRVQYNRQPITDLTLDASLSRGAYQAAIHSGAAAASLDATASGTLSRRLISWDLNADVRHINLKALGLTDSLMAGSLALASTGSMAPALDTISARARVDRLEWMQGAMRLHTDSVTASLQGSLTHTLGSLRNGTLQVKMEADTSLVALLNAASLTAGRVQSQIARRWIDADSLSSALPPLRLNVDGTGSGNLAADFMALSGVRFRNLTLRASNDSVLRASASLLGLATGESLRIDTIRANLRQLGPRLGLSVSMDNRPGTFDEFAHVGMRAAAAGDSIMFYIRQQNIRRQVGYSLGMKARVADSLVSLSFDPLNPVIAYKNWTVNPGNYLSVNPYNYHIAANLDASGDASRVQILSAADPALADSTALDEITVRVTDVKLQDWLSINPFAPPVAGNVSADIRMGYNSQQLNGSGTINLASLTYGKERVGDFDLGLDLSTNRSGVVNAEVALMVDSVKTITAVGALNDSTKSSPFLLDFKMIRMPLKVANPFLPADMARLSGTLNGNMEITGTLARPVFNGTIDFEDAAVAVPMMGSSFRFSTTKIPVDSNVVRFTDYQIFGSNPNPLHINGLVDMTSISAPQIDLSLMADNMQVINSKKRKNVQLYGKAFIDLNATVKGNLSYLDVNAALDVLPQTDVTYIVENATASQIGLQNTSDMVRFVNFADTGAVAVADTVKQSSMALMLDARLDIQQGSTFTVDLSSDGQNRVQLQGDGVLSYSLTPMSTDGRLTGRFTINNGFVRYSLPVISGKNFKFVSGSYVAFNGPMLNPVLSVRATDQVKANVTRQGENSRLVNFDVTLSVSGTMEQMDVAFDLSTIDDITVQNELQSMSPEQRANQAMTLLLYGTYSGPGTSGTANLSGNPLYSFLTSQLNTWAANTIKGVDVSFGMDQYDSTRNGTTTQATSYSYKVSKSLFNNRFKIVVGGNYSTDANSDENLSQNLISDVSFEYLLNDAGSMYVRLFRHTGFESILEGEVTQTGVGFVLKRKLRRLSDLFRFRKPRPVITPQNHAPQP